MESHQEPTSESRGTPMLEGSKLARTLANPWRAQILGELYLRPMSPSQFVEEVGGEISTISRHFRQLADWGYVEVVEEKRGGGRRGGVERVYRTTQRDHLGSEAWATLTPAARAVRSHNAIAFYFRRVTEAVDAGTFDAELDRHFSWDAVSLDRKAWKEVTDRLDDFLSWLPELEAESARRMTESGEEPIPTTVGLSAFRSPTESDLKVLRLQNADAE
jgi:DNA-binding transcriptional ArsR family regulator